MDCREARRLLDEGVTPGSSGAVRPALGFHLAGCAACRRYREAPEADQLLAELLAAPAIEQRRATIRIRPPERRSTLRRILVAGAAAAALGGVALIGWATITLATIRSNVQSMAVPTPPLVTMAPMPAGALAPPLPTALVIPPVAAAQAPTAQMPASPPAETAAIGPEPIGVTAPATSAAWPTAAPLPMATATLTPVPLGGSTQVPTPLPAGRLAPTAARAPGLAAQPHAPAGAMTVLLLGLDRRPGEGGPARMDSIIIARLDPERRRIALLSLPRDLIVEIPGVGYGRINAASVYGELYPQLGGGGASARNTVSTLLGIPIDHVVHVDFQGFIKAIDAIGGVTVDVPHELYDSAYPTMDYQYQVVHFLPGIQRMDGDTALKYARLRHADSDFERMKRQQQVILAAVAQVRGQNVVDQISSVASITGALRGYLSFDIPEDRLVSLVWAFRDVTPEQVERYTLEATQTIEGAPEDPYAQFAVPGAIPALVQKLLYGTS